MEMSTERVFLNAQFIKNANSSSIVLENENHRFEYGTGKPRRYRNGETFNSFGGKARITTKNGEFYDLEFESRASEFTFHLFFHRDGLIDFKVYALEDENVTRFFFGDRPNFYGQTVICENTDECTELVFFILNHFVFV